MPTAGPLEVHCQKALEDIIITSQRIRSSVLGYANNQDDARYLNCIEVLHRQLRAVSGCAETILEVITLQNRTIDKRIITWLFNGGLPPCLDKLREMDDIFKVNSQLGPAAAPALPLRPAVDNITRAIALFEKHKDTFHFLLTPDVRDRQKHPQQPSQPPQPDSHLVAEEISQDTQETTVQSSTHREDGHGENIPQSNADREVSRKKEFYHQKLDEVSRWLAALECTDKHSEVLKQRRQGTCRWFHDIGAYKVWRSSSSPFLWVHGKGGCGKSVLVASLIEHLKSTLEDGDVLVYYYCDFRNERSTNPTEVMRSLLSQLFHHFRDCGVDAGVLPNGILEDKSDGTLTLNNLDRLAHWVMRAAGRFPREPMILIDALDECAQVEKLLPALTILIHSHTRLFVTSRPLEIFKKHFGSYTSLSFHAMGKELAADICSHITQELDFYPQLRSADAELKYQVGEKLREKADGRFRWVQCQLDTLKRCSSKRELQEVLDDLPGELETTYERILSKIDERTSEAKLIRRALVWLIAALAPLSLTQLLDGLSFDPQKRKIHCGTRSLGAVLLEALSSLVLYDKETDILALSHLTVKEYLTSRTALPMYRIIPHEAHIEVTEMCMFYITSLLKQARFRASLAISKSSPMLSYVFSTGLNHLAYVDSASPIALEVVQSFASEVRRHPSHWDLLCELREEDPRRFYPPWPSSRHDLVLCIPVAYSSVNLLDSFFSCSRPLRPRPGTNPLVYAADLWQTAHATALLRSDIDVTVPGLVVDDSRHAFPLEIAVDLGNAALVGELLQRGSLVTSELLSTAVCMPWCSTRVLVQLVQTDAFTKWAQEIGDEELYRAVFNSARPNSGDSLQTDRDHVTLAQRLRELGQDLDPNSPLGAELVKRALNAAHISMLGFLLPSNQPPPDRLLITACTGNTSETVPVVRFLLDKGVNIHAVSRGRRDTALHLAAMSPWEPRALELARILLDAGCNPRARNRRRETPLTIAVRRGYTTLVEHLLSRKAPLPSYILLFALQKRQKSRMIELLLRGGANIDARTASGNTALHLVITRLERVEYEDFQWEEQVVDQVEREALPDRETALQPEDDGDEDNETVDNDSSEEGDWEDDIYGPCEEYQEIEYLELIKILIEAGCDPASRGAEGRTALEVIIGRGDTSEVEHFLSCGSVSLPPGILLTMLEPHLIRNLEIAALLVHNGADVHFTANGDTVLHHTISRYRGSLCLELLKLFIGAGCNPTSYDSRGRTVLELAITQGDASLVDHLLLYGVPLPQDILPTVLQHYSIDNSEIAALLVRRGADVHCTTNDGDTVLHLTLIHYKESFCLDMIKIFVEVGCDLTRLGADSTTVLELAIEAEYTSVVEYLLLHDIPFPPDILPAMLQRYLIDGPEIAALLIRKGANIHCTTNDGDTILHLTVIYYKESICLNLIRVFVEAGCNLAHCGAENTTVLELAIEAEYISVIEYLLLHSVPLPLDIIPAMLQRYLIRSSEIAAFLIRKGANVHCTTGGGDTVLHLTMIHYKESICLDLIKIFVGAGCNLAHRGAEGTTVLELTIEAECAPIIEYLLLHDVPLPPDILPAMLQRYLIRSSEIAALLVHKGADVHYTTNKGDTVLHLTVMHYKELLCLSLIRIFVEAGCDLTRPGAGGATVLELAIEIEYTSVVEYVLLHDVPLPTDVLPAMLQRYLIGSSEIAALLIRKGASVHCITNKGDTVLHLTVMHYKESICFGLIRIFVEAGCDLTRPGAEGTTVLELAIETGYTSVVQLLLSYHDSLPPSILSTALQRHLINNPKIAALLVRKGADIHFTTNSGDTVLHLTVSQYNGLLRLELLKLFIEAGCNSTSCNARGRTVLELAIAEGDTFLVDRLLLYGVPLPQDIISTVLQRRLTNRSGIVELLVRKGANVHFTTSDGDTVLHLTMSRYNGWLRLAFLKLFIRAGCNSASYDAQGRTVLELAVAKGDTSLVDHLLFYGVPLPQDILLSVLQRRLIYSSGIVALLVHRGADVQFITNGGDTALHLTLTRYRGSLCVELTKIFIKAGCSPTSWDSQGKTVLELAIAVGFASMLDDLLSRGIPLPPSIISQWSTANLEHHCTPRFIDHLIGRSSDKHSSVSEEDAALDCSMKLWRERLTYTSLVRTFIEAGCDLDPASYAQAIQGQTILKVSIAHGYDRLVDHLLLCGVQLPPDILLTVLQCCLVRESDTIASLIRKGASVHSTTSGGDTVLHLVIAIYRDGEPMCLELIKLFIEAGCDTMRCNSEGKSIWVSIMERGYGCVLESLFSFNTPRPPDVLLMALWYRLAPRTIYFLLSNGTNATLATATGDTALHLVIAGYWEPTCPELVRRVIGAGCNPKSCNSEGKSVLMAAIEKGYTSVVELLVSYNIPLPPDILLDALLFRANLQTIELLIRHGAAVHSNTLLRIAHTSYPDFAHQVRLADMICTARCAKRAHASLDDETLDHVEKRPRLQAE